MQIKRRTPLATAVTIDSSEMRIGPLAEEASHCRVLIVDDDELVLKRLAAQLHLGGYEIHTATSAAVALRILAQTPCQIVLTDWRMPDMDGLALCRKLRATQDEGYIYVLLLTVRSSRSDIVDGLAAGADDYVVKGASTEELLARIAVGRRITTLERSLRSSDRENRRLSITDALTGVHNRRFLMIYLPRELERARRCGHSLAVLSCDIDHFKRVNDEFGHEAGDEVLREFARRTEGCIHQMTDWIARAGGEEFVLVLPEADVAEASVVAERVRLALSAEAIPTCSGPVAITVSVGVCVLQTERELREATVPNLLGAADRALYASKRSGRDRVTTMPVGPAQLESGSRAGDTHGTG
jgi:two-component system, cell cycle response regulator